MLHKHLLKYNAKVYAPHYAIDTGRATNPDEIVFTTLPDYDGKVMKGRKKLTEILREGLRSKPVSNREARVMRVKRIGMDGERYSVEFIARKKQQIK